MTRRSTAEGAKYSMHIDGLDLEYAHGLWTGPVTSRFGVIEVLFGGTAEFPDEEEIAAFRRFAVALDDNIAKLRKKVSFGSLYQPIRIAINNEKRVGVQFRNRITKNQTTLILEDQSPNRSL